MLLSLTPEDLGAMELNIIIIIIIIIGPLFLIPVSIPGSNCFKYIGSTYSPFAARMCSIVNLRIWLSTRFP